jgi:hypothetical protein
MAGKEAQHLFETLLHSNENPHVSGLMDTKSMKLTGQFYSGKRGTTLVEFCFTAMTIHTVSNLIDASSMDLTGKCLRREKEAQNQLNAAAQQ